MLDLEFDTRDCPHDRRHLAQSWPGGPSVERCRDCGAVLSA